MGLTLGRGAFELQEGGFPARGVPEKKPGSVGSRMACQNNQEPWGLKARKRVWMGSLGL